MGYCAASHLDIVLERLEDFLKSNLFLKKKITYIYIFYLLFIFFTYHLYFFLIIYIFFLILFSFLICSVEFFYYFFWFVYYYFFDQGVRGLCYCKY